MVSAFGCEKKEKKKTSPFIQVREKGIGEAGIQGYIGLDVTGFLSFRSPKVS